MVKHKESNILIVISTLSQVISIFVGPFLTAYFIKISTDSLTYLSLYNIMCFIVLGLGAVVVGWIVRNKFKIGMFRIGVIFNFIYIFTIIFLKEKILNHLFLIGFLYGVSSITYNYPYNLFLSGTVKNKDRVNYEFNKNTISSLIAIIVPIILGGIITTVNFYLTAIVILVISLIQIILSFFIKPIDNKKYKFSLNKALKKFIKDKEIIYMFIIDYFKGMNISDGALSVILTVLVFNSFKTDLNLGILSSLASIFSIFVRYLYAKNNDSVNKKFIILLCSIVPVFSLLLLSFYTSDLTLVLYYFCYNIFVNLLSLMLTVKLYNISNCKKIKNDYQMEFWTIREIVLNLGRITGFIILLFIAYFGNISNLYYFMILLSLSIIIMGYLYTKIINYDDVD